MRRYIVYLAHVIRNADNIAENLKARNNLGDINVDGRIILKWILREQSV
jgi:hypothetical protein